MENQFLGISYNTPTNDVQVGLSSHPLSPRDRARVVLKHLKINNHPELSHSQKEQVCRLILDFHDVFAIEDCDNVILVILRIISIQ